MAHPVELSKMNTAEPPPPCVIAGQPEEQAFATAKGFVTNIYGAMDSGSHEHIPFRADSVACFQKGAADRYQVCGARERRVFRFVLGRLVRYPVQFAVGFCVFLKINEKKK